MSTDDIRGRFPATLETVPDGHCVDPSDSPPVWLVEGEVRSFAGEGRTVRSPVAVVGGGQDERVVLGHEASLGEREAELAVQAAVRAWGEGRGPWPAASVEERIAAAERFADHLDRSVDRVARLLMWEIGKPWAAARKEVQRSAEYIRDSVGELHRLVDASRGVFTGSKGSTVHHARELRLPLGVVLCVAPFNYPVNELLTTVVPALLMGNVVIAKTPRFGVLANMALADSLASCFPPGTISLLPGDGKAVIPAVMRAKGSNGKGSVDMLAFIGSEGAAHAILGHHPSPITLHKVLGLGSKNAAVVLPGADLDRAVPLIVKGALGFNGQRCTAEKILFVPRRDAEAFAARVAAEVERLCVGMPWEDAAITPLPEDNKLAWMREYIDQACTGGAAIVNAGGGDGHGSLMRPAVLCPVSTSMKIFHEEQFGPIVPIAPYDDVEEVIRWQMQSPFGQQVGLWGPEDALAPLVDAFAPLVARVNLNDVCQRGPDSFGFTATDKSGFGILSLREALITFSRPALVQSTRRETLDAATSTL